MFESSNSHEMIGTRQLFLSVYTLLLILVSVWNTIGKIPESIAELSLCPQQPLTHMNPQQEWWQKGCDACRQSALGAGGPPIVDVGHIGGGHLLRRCSACGAYWEFGLREAHVITSDQARELLPDAFT